MGEMFSANEIKTLVKIVGREGAIAALEQGTKYKLQDLLAFAKKNNINPGKNPTKKSIASTIVRHIDRRIQKSLDELKKMSKEELVVYFNEIECDQKEILELLESIDLKSKVKSKNALIEFAAIQIQSLGVFERLSFGNSKTGHEQPAV